jgi:hypothetical protein
MRRAAWSQGLVECPLRKTRRSTCPSIDVQPHTGATATTRSGGSRKDEIRDVLNYRLDEPPPCHGVIEPAWRMTLDDYELALAETHDAWAECR